MFSKYFMDINPTAEPLLTNDQLYILLWVFFGLMILVAILTVSIQKSFMKKNEFYALKQSSNQKTGYEVAQAILKKNGITNVSVVKGQEGRDHYDPRTGTISLSPSVYDSSSVSAMAVAAHECGHAIQWHKKSIMIRVRTVLTNPVQIATMVGQSFFSAGLLFILIFGFSAWFTWITIGGVILYLAMGVFQLVTLPIEFDASRRAKKQLSELNFMVTENDIKGTKGVLNAAAMTYVVAFLSTLIILTMFIIRLILILRSNR